MDGQNICFRIKLELLCYIPALESIPSMKHGGGSVAIWASFAASVPGLYAIIDGIINSESYHQFQKENLRRSVRKLSLNSFYQ